MGGVGPCVRGASLSRSQASDAESQAVPLLRIRRWRACLALSVLPKSPSQLIGEPSREGGVTAGVICGGWRARTPHAYTPSRVSIVGVRFSVPDRFASRGI